MTLADEVHFARAAERLKIAQPALSQQIRRLEDKAGMAWSTAPRSEYLTDAGRVLVEQARRVLHEADVAVALLDKRRRSTRRASGHRRVVDARGSRPVWRPRGFHKRFPDVEFAVREGVIFKLAESLRRDELDLAFLTIAYAPGLESVSIVDESLVAVVSPAHRLAGRAASEDVRPGRRDARHASAERDD